MGIQDITPVSHLYPLIGSSIRPASSNVPTLLEKLLSNEPYMTFYNENLLEQVKDAADIVEVIGEQVKLRRSGINYKGLCPFHGEKTPSFMVNPERRSFHCFGCGEGGNVFTFMMKFYHLTFPEAVKQLAERYHVQLPEKKFSAAERERLNKRNGLYEANKKASAVYHDFLLNKSGGEKAREYLRKRGIAPEVITDFQLGYAPESWDFIYKKFSSPAGSLEAAVEAGLLAANKRGGYYDRFRDRLLCPLFDLSGRVIGFGGRILGQGEPKYLNTPESPIYNKSRELFGLYQNKKEIQQSRQVILVEGNFDLLSLVVHGIKNVCAPLGTALTRQQIKILKRYCRKAILLFDGDSAGVKAAMRAVPFFLSEELEARIVILPDEHDPDTFVNDFGPEKLQEKISRAESLPEFVFSRLVAEHGLSLEGKGKIVTELRPLLKAIGDDNLQRSIFADHFSRKLGLQPEQLLDKFSVPPPLEREYKKTTAPRVELPFKQRQLLEFLIFYPEYFKNFCAAGLEMVLVHQSVALILEKMKVIFQQEMSSADRLLDELSGPERSLLSALMVNPPAWAPETEKEQAGEIMDWITEQKLVGERATVLSRINEAQLANDDILLMELLNRKKEIDEMLTK